MQSQLWGSHEIGSPRGSLSRSCLLYGQCRDYAHDHAHDRARVRAHGLCQCTPPH